MKIARESILLAAICTADMITTLWLVTSGLAVEANPVMRFYLEQGGAIAFAAAKVLLFAGPLFALELLRRRRPQFIGSLLRAAVVLYLLVYGVGVLALNSPSRAATPPVAAHP